MPDATHLFGRINSKSLNRLSEQLEILGVHVNTGGELAEECRGGACFAAFSPMESCLRLPDSTLKYYQDAVRFGLLDNTRAHDLSYNLASICFSLKPAYKGYLSPLLNGGSFDVFLSENLSPREFRLRESAHGWFADALCSVFPWAIIPSIHLKNRGFTQAVLSRKNVKQFAQNPYLALMTALDLVVWGAWYGYSPADLQRSLTWFRDISQNADIDEIITVPGDGSERIIIPFFSHGFQGAVFGFFHGLQPHLKEPVLNLLYQYGQSLADSYALLRRQEFLRATAEANDAETVAAATLRIVSPVEQLVIETQGRVHGFVLREEDGYWAGFDEIRMPEATTLRDRLSNDDACKVNRPGIVGGSNS